MGSLSVLVAQALFLSVCIVLIVVNVKHAHGCGGGGYDAGSASVRREALERRLAAMEAEVKENSELLHDLLMDFEDRFAITDFLDLRALKRECHDAAEAVVAHLAEDAPPPMPAFAQPADEFAEPYGDGGEGYRDDLFAGEGYESAAAASLRRFLIFLRTRPV